MLCIANANITNILIIAGTCILDARKFNSLDTLDFWLLRKSKKRRCPKILEAGATNNIKDLFASSVYSHACAFEVV